VCIGKTDRISILSLRSLVSVQVGRAARQALDIDTPLIRVEMESLESSLLAEQLDPVNVLVATVVTGTGVTLGVLVGHGGAEGIENGTGRDVLRGDENNRLPLTLNLVLLWWGLSMTAEQHVRFSEIQ
jgi:hypothetical protein